MFSEKDKQQIINRGSEEQNVIKQIENFKKGFPYLQVEEAASVNNGIIQLDTEHLKKNILRYEEKVTRGLIPLKFVPASGAASRMFKALFEALAECEKSDNPEKTIMRNKAVAQFVSEIKKFAFYNDLTKAIETKGSEKNNVNLIDFLLNEKGLNYGSLPKGLLKFHAYKNGARTPFEEHLVEGAHHAMDSQRIVRLHFTVSPEHQSAFEQLLNEIKKDKKSWKLLLKWLLASKNHQLIPLQLI